MKTIIPFILIVAGASVTMSQNLESKETLSHGQDQTPAMPSQMLPIPLRQFSPKIIFRKLHPDPEHCYQVKKIDYLANFILFR